MSLTSYQAAPPRDPINAATIGRKVRMARGYFEMAVKSFETVAIRPGYFLDFSGEKGSLCVRYGMTQRTTILKFLWHPGLLLLTAVTAFSQDATPSQPALLPVTDVKLDRPVDFQADILPFLKENCLACHNQTKAKASLILETPQTILKGGDAGPAIVVGKGSESFLFQVAAHQVEETVMPPRDNKVGARSLTPHELGLLKLWIDEGAKGEVKALGPVAWQALPANLNPIYAVAVTPDGQFAACGRANQVFIYHLPSKTLVARLSDPRLIRSGLYAKAGAAHLDMVNSLEFSADGSLLASGGYREVKLWRRPRDPQKLKLAALTSAPFSAGAISRDRTQLAAGGADGRIHLWNVSEARELKTLEGHTNRVLDLAFSPDNSRLLSVDDDGLLLLWDPAAGSSILRTNVKARAVAWLSDQQLASGGEDNVIRVWQIAEAGQELNQLGELSGHSGPVTALAGITPTQLLSGSSDGTVRHWDLEKGEPVRQMDHGGPVEAVAVRPDGKRFAAAGLNKVAKLWDAADGKQLAEMKGDRYAGENLAKAERTTKLAAGEITFQKSAVAAAEEQRKKDEERAGKAKEAFASAEKSFVEKQAGLTNAIAGKAELEKTLAELAAQLSSATNALATAERAAGASEAEAKSAADRATELQAQAEKAVSNKAQIEKLASGSGDAQPALTGELKAIAGKLASEATALVAAAKSFSQKLAAEAAARRAQANEAREEANQTRAEIEPKQRQAEEKVKAAVKRIDDADKELKKAEMAKSIAENELQLATHATERTSNSVVQAQEALKSAEAAAKAAEANLEAARTVVTESEQPIHALAFSPDSRLLATAGDDRRVHTWSAEDGVPFETLRGHEDAGRMLAFGGDGTLLSGAEDRSGILWDLNADWLLEGTIGTGDAASPIADRVYALAFTPDGLQLATGGGEPSRGGEIKVWDVAGGKLLQDLPNVHSDTVLSLHFAADGNHLASGSADRFAKVVDRAAGKVVKTFEGHTHHVLGVALSSDGRTLATAGADNVVKVWNVVTGERKKNVEGFGKEVTSVQFIPGLDQFVAAAGDKQVKLFRENGEVTRTFAGASDFLHSVTATPDGRMIVAGGQDGILRVWNGSNGESIVIFPPPESLALSR